MVATVIFLARPALAEGMLTTLRVSAWAAGGDGVHRGVQRCGTQAVAHAPAPCLAPTLATLCLSLSSPTGALLGVLLLGEVFSVWLAAKFSFVVAGLVVALAGGCTRMV